MRSVRARELLFYDHCVKICAGQGCESARFVNSHSLLRFRNFFKIWSPGRNSKSLHSLLRAAEHTPGESDANIIGYFALQTVTKHTERPFKPSGDHEPLLGLAKKLQLPEE